MTVEQSLQGSGGTPGPEDAPPDAGTPWEYVTLDRFQAPRSSTKVAVHRGFSGLVERLKGWWRWLQRRGRQEEVAEPVIALEMLERIPPSRLDRIVPEPEWAGVARALEAALDGWLASDTPGPRVQVVVGAPHDGTPEAIVAWAQARGWSVIEAPRRDEVLAGGEEWMGRLTGGADEPVVIPRLEACYLRHHQGLALIRRLVDWLLARRRRCLIGCSSWAWAYLCRAMALGSVFPPPLTLQALDQERLQHWFADLATRSHDTPPAFRQSDNGKWVLPPPAPAEGAGGGGGGDEDSEAKPEISGFMGYLAAHSRGIPGVAWAIWRHGLRLVPDQKEDEGEEDREAREEAQARDAHTPTYWVRPWLQIRLPTVPEPPGRDVLFVLHALLLHGRLSARDLSRILPLSDFRILQLLDTLQVRSVLEPVGEEWQVAALGYPAVRQALVQEGYLVDGL